MAEGRSFRYDDRGLSEVLGYAIVFSLVVTSVLLVTVGGVSIIENARDAERVENADRAFDVAAENFADIYERDAPSRSTEIELGEAAMFYDNNVSMTVTGDGSTLAEYQLRPIEMRLTDDRSLVYEGGAVFRMEGSGERMARDPPFLLGERAHIPVVQTVTPVIESSSSTTILLRGVSTERSVLAHGESYDEVTITINSPRYEAWAAGLQSSRVDCGTTPADETAECTLSGTDIPTSVTLQQIEVSLVV